MELVNGIVIMVALALIFGAALGYAQQRLAADDDPVVARIDALLPQTQCAQCGYPGCRPYAEAIAAGDAINKCPPGGSSTVVQLAELLGRPAEPLAADPGPARVAFIREEDCIGCTLCIKACPVDAIVGAQRLTHTVIRSECTGCDLCLPPCPVDCIDMLPLTANTDQSAA